MRVERERTGGEDKIAWRGARRQVVREREGLRGSIRDLDPELNERRRSSRGGLPIVDVQHQREAVVINFRDRQRQGQQHQRRWTRWYTNWSRMERQRSVWMACLSPFDSIDAHCQRGSLGRATVRSEQNRRQSPPLPEIPFFLSAAYPPCGIQRARTRFFVVLLAILRLAEITTCFGGGARVNCREGEIGQT